MLRGNGLSLRFAVFGFLFMILFLGLVSADNEPNNSPDQAEDIDEGTHTGSLSYSDIGDWYRVTGMGEHEVTVRASITSDGPDESVHVFSMTPAGITDGQIDIYLGVEQRVDTCHWKDETGQGAMYLKVDGIGDYELRITWGDDGGFIPTFTENPLCMICLGGFIFAMGAIMTFGIWYVIAHVMSGPKTT